MNKHEVIKWLRQEAEKLLVAADSLEDGRSSGSGQNGKSTTSGQIPKKTRIFNAGFVRNRLKEKNARPSDIAKHFGVTVDEVNNLIQDPTNGITIGKRGWLKAA